MKRYYYAMRWIATFLALALFLALLPAVVIDRTPPTWAPEWLRNWGFDTRLLLAPIAKKFLSVSRGSIWNDRVYVDNLGETVSFRSRDVTIVGTLYRPEFESVHPAILLIPGSTPEGRKMGLYRILGHELAHCGYIVLSIDQRAQGDSDKPPRLDSPAAFDYVGDVRRAISYLSTLKDVDLGKMFVIGHSFGGDVAITAGIEEPRIQKIVAIGPGLRDQERTGEEAGNANESAYLERRMMRYSGFSQPIPKEAATIGAGIPLEYHLAYFSQPEHKPLLVIIGMLESEKDRRFLQEIYKDIVPPSKQVTLAGADHYANVAGFGSVIIYDWFVVDQLVEEIDSWLSGSRPSKVEQARAQEGYTWPGISLVLFASIILGVLLLMVGMKEYILRREI